MEQREFNIEIYHNDDWWITTKNHDFNKYYREDEEVEDEDLIPFAQWTFKDKKITYLFDNGLYNDRRIDPIRNHKAFQEVVKFYVFINDVKQALEYIKDVIIKQTTMILRKWFLIIYFIIYKNLDFLYLNYHK